MITMTPVSPDIRQHIIDKCKSYQAKDPTHRNNHMHKYQFYTMTTPITTTIHPNSDEEFIVCLGKDGECYCPLNTPWDATWYYAKKMKPKIKAVIRKKLTKP